MRSTLTRIKPAAAGAWPHAGNNIGRMARIELQKFLGVPVVGNVIDLVAGTGEPKRIRIQHGLPELAGQIVFPAEYRFIGWANEEED